MGKRDKVKVEGNTITIGADNMKDALDALMPKPYEITSASIKEAQCTYGYEINTGPATGDKIPTRKGSAIVHDDMINAFGELTVHLAIIGDAFKHVYEELPTLDELKKHSIVQEFSITGFKVQGDEENKGYFLNGEKWVTLGVMGSDTMKVSSSSGYKFFSELKESIEKCQKEVELYMGGKAAPKEAAQPELPFTTSASEFDEEE